MTVNTVIGKITASKEVLNDLSLMLAKVDYDSFIEKEAHKAADEIYMRLLEEGMYDSIRK